MLSRSLKIALQRGGPERRVPRRAPSVRQPEVVPLTTTEARRVLELAASRRNAARWFVALALGLRQGEALRLTWPDIDLEAGTLRVRETQHRRKWQHGSGT